MNCIFTIVAKNYLALALTLGDSIKVNHPDYDFIIFLADGVDGDVDLSRQKYKIVEVQDLHIDHWLDLAFKYDISEFSTSIKPFCFEYLMKNYFYENIMYFDPDIYIYGNLNRIENLLRENFCVITPHHSDLELNWSGAVPEGNILISGIFNLGFIAFNNSENSKFIFRWWKKRLQDKCYLERTEGFFYDQNWIQFLVSCFDEGVFILRDYGHNIAWWNLHERAIKFEGEVPYVLHKADSVRYGCVFFHFSGFDVLDQTIINKRYRKNPLFALEHQPDLAKLFSHYSERVIGNGHRDFCKLKYRFNHFDNGYVVAKLHRRLYKELTSKDRGYKNMDNVRKSLITRIQTMNFTFENPFSIREGSFFDLLNKNGLILKETTLPIDSINADRDSGQFYSKIILATKIMSFMKKILGIKKYIAMMKFINLYSRDEYQIFLIKNLGSKDRE